MGLRCRASWFGPFLAGTVALLLTPGQAQSQPAATRAWTQPRTPDGRPDLQGRWLSRSATPLERPKALEGKALLTDEEVAELKARADRLFKSGNGDFAAGDAVFLAALANPDHFTSPTATSGSSEMPDREFDHHTSLVTDPADGHIPPLTPDAQRRRDERAAAARRLDGPEDFDNAMRCIAWGTPRLGGRYGAGDLGYYQIVQTPGYVVLFMETGHEARIIPLDGRPGPPARIGFWSGDSRGRWDGDSLVIETANFSPKSNFMGAGENLHLTERLTRVAADTIRYELTLSDPTTWTRPWSAEMPLKWTDEALYESACHEGNAPIITGMLSGAHADTSNPRSPR